MTGGTASPPFTTIPLSLNFPRAVPELVGDVVRLREPAEADIPAWYARATDVESAAMAGDPVPASIDAGIAWLSKMRERFARQAGIRWAIVPAGSSQSIGSIGLAIASSEEGIADLGFVIGRAHWGQGIGTAAARLVARYAFDSLGVSQIRAELLQSNVASRRVLEKAGFTMERVLPEFEPTATGFDEGYLYVLRASRVR